MHRLHPDPRRDDPEDAILYDDCDDCAAKVEHLTLLDRTNLERLYRLTIRVETYDASYRTATEAAAGRRLHEMLVVMQRLGFDKFDVLRPKETQ